MKVLLVEPYYGGSHRAWADGYARHSSHEVRLITHPGRWWKWRMKGGAVTLAGSLGSLEGWTPDVVLVSDMIDLAHFRALARPHIGDSPTALYFHESQLTYPTQPGSSPDHTYSLINWISACAADIVLFNSGYHRQVFFESLGGLLARFPDMGHDHLIQGVESRSEILPVGVDLLLGPPALRREGHPADSVEPSLGVRQGPRGVRRRCRASHRHGCVEAILVKSLSVQECDGSPNLST